MILTYNHDKYPGRLSYMIQWKNPRYYALGHYIKETFKEKLYKISLDGGMTCPNRDGTIDTRGCIFCSEDGSGDFAGDKTLSITKQLSIGKEQLRRKTSAQSYIAYFQAFTNTYADISYLKKIYYEAIDDPCVKVLSIATRPDCLSTEIIALLAEINKIKPVWIELGLQTVCESCATQIRRGYPLEIFEDAITKLRAHNIDIIVHTIIGLPFEEKNGIIETLQYLNTKDIQGVKLQLLHVLKQTDLADLYLQHPFWLPSLQEYLDLLGNCISMLRPDIVIHRLTGDGPKDLLIAPLWTCNKRLVLNSIAKHLKEHDIWQGKTYQHKEI